MMEPNLPKLLTTVALLVCGLAALGCESSGPEFASGNTRVIEGVLEPEETSDSDFFAITSSGTVNILASTVEALDPETGEPIVDPLLGVSVGQPDAADASVCQLTFTQVLEEGESFSIYFIDGLFCLTIFRDPAAQPESVVNYVVTMTGAFS